MLKIKDNIDLKELEKFGFEVFGKNTAKRIFYGHEYDKDSPLGYLEDETYILIEHRIIWLIQDNACDSNERYFGNPQFDIIYDLIEAGLVEKV